MKQVVKLGKRLWGTLLCLCFLLVAQRVDARLPETLEGPHDDEDTLSVSGIQGDNFYLDLDLRGRGEYRNGYMATRKNGQRPAWLIGERERITMGYRRGALSTGLSVQHVGVWGDDGLDGSKGKFGLNEAWARCDGQAGWFMQVGRQVLSYDDERIFGADDWSNAGYSHNVIRLGYKHDVHTLHGIVGFNQLGEKRIGGTYYNGPMPYKNLQFIWYHFDDPDFPLRSSLMFLNQGLEIGKEDKPKTGYMQMLGGWFRCDLGNWYGKAEFYYEMGHDRNQRKMSACLFGGRLGYEESRWGAALGLDVTSGAKNSLPWGTNNTYDMLYGSSHKFFGAMDYFAQGTIPTAGMAVGSVAVHGSPVRNLHLWLDYNGFAMTHARSSIRRLLGNELDIRAQYKLMKDVELEAGYSMMLPTTSLAQLKGGSVDAWQDWGWLSIRFSPRIFMIRK